MQVSEPANTESRTYPATATTRDDIALPTELGEALGIAAGDTVEVRILDNQLIVRRVENETLPSPRGLLRDYFSDWDDINRFIEGERNGWEERDELLAEDRELLWERFSTSSD